MENKRILPFAFGDNLVRVLEDELGNPWWVAKDVCDILGLANSRKAVSELDEDEKITVTNGDGNPRAGIPHQYTLISESGLYSLIFRSRKPEAKAFSKWVRSEVLPTIRKTGSYERKRHTGCIPGRPALPDELPPEALKLRPGMRQKLWENALQTARLDGGDSASALDIFVWLCRMVAEQPPAPPTGYDKVRAFFFQCCSHAAGHRESAADLYDAFRIWHRNHKGNIPSRKVFGLCLQEFVERSRSNGTFYNNLLLNRDRL